MPGLRVVKVGGSLYELPDLGERLRGWLAVQESPHTLLVPGGGATADVVRAFDARHGLGEEDAHWLALRCLSLNAHFLARLLPGTPVLADPTRCRGRCLLDAHAFACADEGTPGSLPHSWAVTSDSVAARVAVVTGAEELVLLKSVTVPADLDWEEAGQQGIVDRAFAGVVRRATGLRVRAVNLRLAGGGPRTQCPGD